MSSSIDPEAQRLAAAEEYDLPSDDEEYEDATSSSQYRTADSRSSGATMGNNGLGSRSPYHLPASEQLRGVANRIIFSRYYILFYFAMMSLSFATLVISLISTHQRHCPPVAWHILEVIINALMVLEVTTRWVAYGKKYPLTLLNIVDLALVAFCSITLILVFRNPCGSGTRSEEVLDTILIVIRNAVQFLRLGSILRRSGHSLFNPPKPIDLSQARTASLALDLDLDLDDEEAVAERHLSGGSRRTLVGVGNYQPLDSEERRTGTGVRDNAGRETLDEDDQDTWDRLD
ncbi:hypothetical protein CI109_107371 [Kwoniella shandongensis]|uniref:Ion transport domain-containing protein n=1 Tax=Kwoniella shandongensis TaxID=1734106 RepID=A0A5M6BZW4_9TREE|nr:uncharacterized protein CI109_004701 [Kwoniella shandongensis]KAA5526925.1 hypothetical protein CI109_004701 [Kwoniella shandongensis]